MFGLTAHDVDLTYYNFADPAWPFGFYITYVGVALCFNTQRALVVYRLWILVLGAGSRCRRKGPSACRDRFQSELRIARIARAAPPRHLAAPGLSASARQALADWSRKSLDFAESGADAEELKRSGLRSVLRIPMRLRGEILGFVVI